jgi:hypothetical protein
LLIKNKITKKLIDKIPDISNQQTDDINTIEYLSQGETVNIFNDATIKLKMLNNSDGLISSNTDSECSITSESDKIEPSLNEQPPNYFESETAHWITKKQISLKPSAPVDF